MPTKAETDLAALQKMRGMGQMTDREAAGTRPAVGPADPETRRKKLREVLDEPTRAEGVAPRTMKDAVDAGVEMGSETLPNGEKRRAVPKKPPKRNLKRRFGPNGKTEDDLGA